MYLLHLSGIKNFVKNFEITKLTKCDQSQKILPAKKFFVGTILCIKGLLFAVKKQNCLSF